MAVCYDRSRAFYVSRLRTFTLGIEYRLHTDGIYWLVHHQCGVCQLVVLGDDSDQDYNGYLRQDHRRYDTYKK